MPETAVKPAKFKAEFYPDSADKSPFVSKIAEQDSAPTTHLPVGAESCSAIFPK